LDLLHAGTYHEDNTFEDDNPTECTAVRTDFIQLRDIRRIEKEIEAEHIQLHSDDGRSTLLWVERLRDKGHLLGFKSKTDPPPADSYLADDVFTIMIQTGWQRKMYQKYGSAILCIDVTHNVTMYKHLNLTTLVVHDSWAHGIPVGWMLASNGCQETIHYFVRLVQNQSPLVIPRYIMTDFDHAQINACRAGYRSQAFILLCWWHLLHAWQQHFAISKFPELWELLKKWVRMDEEEDFKQAWREIQRTALSKVVQYLTDYWMPDTVVRMWSASHHRTRTIFEMCDTNMLVEVYVLLSI
jgi:hypothetical protein